MKKFYLLFSALFLSLLSFSQTQMDLPVTFDDVTVNYGVVGFGGAEQSTIVTDPTLATNKVAKVIKTNTAELWAGTTVTALAGTVQTGFATNIPFSATEKKMNVRVWSPHTNIQVRLKVEDKTDPTKSVETEATFTGTAGSWQVLEFNFANQAAGTAALNLAFAYNKASIFFNFGVTGATAGERTYYFDDVKFGAVGGGGGLTQMNLPVTFDDVTVEYGVVGFGGAEQSTIVTDPTLATNKVAKVIKTNTAELWAGTTVTALAGTVQTGFATNIPFSATEKKMNVRVWSPHTNIQVRLKVEDKTDPTKSVETEATFTGTAGSWQVLEFNFANQAAGTAALNLAFAYNKASIFFNFGVTGATAGERTYYFDDVKFGAVGGGGGLTQMNLPVTFDDVTVNYGVVGFGGAEQSTIVTDPTLATNKVAKVIKTNTAELWAGTTVTALAGTVQTGFATNIPFSATEKKMNVRVWSPHTNIQVRLKVEDKTDPTKSVETEATFTGTAGSWQVLEFNFANQAAGTAALNLAFAYNKASIFFNFGVTGATAGERTYYFDDVKFGAVGGGGGLTQMDLPVTFDDVTVNYGVVGFGGAEQSTIVTDPTLATNKVAKVIKTNTAELWAGTTVTALAGTVQTGFATNIPFSATEKKMNVRVWSPHTNIQVRLKVEDKTDPTKSVETEATFTGTAGSWQVLEFNFANQAAGTAALNLAFAYNKASIFFNFGVTGATAGERTYYFDDVKFGAVGGGGGLTQMDLPVTFDDVTVNYGVVGFGGAEQSTIVTDPTLATNKVAKVIKTNTAELWAGTTVTALAGTVQTGFATNIPFSATEKKMNVRVWSPHTNIQVRLKVEDKTDPTKSVETEATFTGTAGSWQVLEFNFANQAAGTAALNLAFAYNKASIFFNFGVTGATAGERTYYFDDVKFGAVGGGGGLTQMDLPVTFDDVTVNYGVVGFGGAEQSTIVTDPTLATNKVAKVIKTNTAELWAGTTVTALNGTVQTGFATNIPFTASAQKMNVRVWSPHTNIPVRLKVEDKTDPTKSVETETMFTGTAGSWQVLEFNFANQAAGTAALNLAFAYNKASIFFNFGVTGATAGERTYYFDDVKFGAVGGGGGLTQMDLPVTFDDVTVNYGVVGFGGAEQSTIVTDPTLATNKVAKVIKTNTAELWAGTTVTALAGTVQTGFATNIPFSATEKKMNVRVWSPHTNIQVRLKVEDKTDPTKSVETEATFTGTAGSWQVLEFNFANQAAGTAALNLAFAYNKASIFFNFGVTGATAGERTYYFDDVKFGAVGGGGGLTQMNLPVTFDDVTVEYGVVGFGGAEQSTIVTDPTLATNKVAKVIKTNTAELWAGTTVTALNGTVQTGFATNIPFSATEKKMNVRVWSPHTNIQVRLKVEDKTDPTKSVETEATFTGTAGSWQVLEFNFANQAAGTAALNLAFAYNKASIFFNFGVTGATAGERTYYFDDVKFGAVGGGGGLTQMNLPVTFDDVTVEYGVVGFGGAEQSTIVTDPTLATNKVAKVIKTNTAELWAGTTVTALAGTVQTGFATNIPFSATEKKMNVRVWSPHTNIQVRLKVEDKTDPTKSVETEATFTGTAGSWQVLEFNFANQAAGTAALNLAFAYNKASIFFNFGVTGATAGERTYYFDDVKFGAVGGGGGLTQMDLPVTFDDVTVNYGVVGFGGAEQSTIVTDPTLATNKVAKVIKTNTAELWAGTTVTALAGTVQTGFATNIPFSATEKKMNVRVWSPHTNIQVRLKVEDKTDPTKSVETEATFTGTAGSWQVLEFNFANQAAGTAALNLAFAYNKASIFFNFGVTGATAGERTYYFDDVKFGAVGGGGGLTQMNLPVTFDDVTVNYGVVGFGGAEQSTIVTDPTLATNKVAKVIKTNTAELWAGTTVTALAGTVQTGFATNIPFSATEKKMNVRVWSPHTNIQVRLKVEDKTDPTKSVETEATFTGTAGSWQVLEFNFANQAAGTAALNLAFAYNKASIFFNFGVTGATAGERTYYFDDVKFGAVGGGGGLTQMDLPVTFDDVTVNYGVVGFGGAEQSTIVTDPTLATNKVAKVIKTNTAELWAGTTVTALNGTVQTGFATNIPFTASAQKMNVRVWSPHTNIPVRLKVEDKTDPTKSVETETMFTGTAGSWQVLEFNFANQVAGTAALNLATAYNKASIFFNFGTTGATAGERTYYFDDVKFGAVGGGGGLTQMNLPVTFDDVTVNYGVVGFGGAEQSTIVTDPTLATNKVAKVIKTNTAELWAGTTVTALNGTVQTGFANNIPFAVGSTKMNVRVWSPHTNIQVRLKVEDKTDPTKSCETEATFTGTAGSWQVLEFNFANQATGTAALNLAFAYNKASIFFNFGVTGATAGERTYYFDDVKFGAIPPPPAPTVTSPVRYCQNATAVSLTATASAGNTLRWYTVPTGGTASTTAPTPSTATAGTTNYYVSQVNASMTEGARATIAVIVDAAPAAPTVSSTINYCLNSSAQILTADAASGNTLKWYTAAVGGSASLTAPIPTTNVVGNKSYYVSQTNATGCESPRAVIIVATKALPATPVIAASPGSTLYPGQTTTIAVTASTGNTNAWYRNGILLLGQTGNSVNVNVDALGSYSLKVTNTDGCTNTSNTVVVSGANNDRLFVYPNPSTGQFQVRYYSDINNLSPRRIAVYNAGGKLVFSSTNVIFGAYTSMTVDLSRQSAGHYFVHLMDNNGKTLKTEQVFISR